MTDYWRNLRPHPVGCRCAPNGWDCEQAQAVAEESAERREMSGRYPYSEEAGW